VLAKPRSAADWAIVAALIRCNRLDAGWAFRTAGRGALRTKFVWWSALPLLVAVPGVSNAEAQAPTSTSAAPDQTVDFSADQVIYDSDADVVTATGEVRMRREGQYLAAERVTWNRKTDEVRAQGSVVLLTPQGDKLVGQDAVLTNEMHDAAISNLMVVLENGGRVAAERGSRRGDITTLENAIYSPCPVTTDTGCP